LSGKSSSALSEFDTVRCSYNFSCILRPQRRLQCNRNVGQLLD
jgi:hypothetical protein